VEQPAGRDVVGADVVAEQPRTAEQELVVER
jgi:hypothetical protein